MRLHRFDYFLVNVEFLENSFADFHMRSLDIVVHRLAYVVKKGAFFGHTDVRFQFGGQHSGDMSRFNGMLQDILPVTGSEIQPTQHSKKTRVQINYARFISGHFSFLFDGFFHFAPGFFHHFFNPGRLNSSVRDKIFQGDSRRLPSDRIKTRDDNGPRRIVHDNFHARRPFQRPDVSPLFAYDFALKVVRWDRDGGGSYLRSGGRSQPLNGRNQYVAGSFFKLVPPQRFQFFDAPENILFVFLFRRLQKVGLGFFFGHSGDFLQFRHFLPFNAFYFFFFLFQFFYAFIYLRIGFVYAQPLLFQTFFPLQNSFFQFARLGKGVFFLLLGAVQNGLRLFGGFFRSGLSFVFSFKKNLFCL